MNIVTYGGGTNSTALIIECINRNIPIDLIIFADTGAEKPHTYKYISIFSDWLKSKNYPEIIIVKHKKTLEQECLEYKQLPSIVYGRKQCSDKFKIRPIQKYLNENFKNQKITKLIGFDAGEQRRIAKALLFKTEKNNARFPLNEWGINRKQCVEIIKNAGLCLPGKSACFFCPSSKPSEIRALNEIYPDLFKRAINLENNANLTKIKGLGHDFSWQEIVKNNDLFDDDYYILPELICECYD